MTILVPGKNHPVTVGETSRKAPYLLRDVEGDFTMQIRVSGNFIPSGLGCRQAGLMLTVGSEVVAVQAMVEVKDDWHLPEIFLKNMVLDSQGAHAWFCADYCPGPSDLIYLRLVRRGSHLYAEYSDDGKKWILFRGALDVLCGYGGDDGKELPKRLKVGVMASSTAEGTFKATFDQFKLTTP